MPHPPHAITNVTVDGCAEESAVRVALCMDVEVRAEGFHFVPLLPHTVAVKDVEVTVDGKDAAATGAHFLPHSGRHTLLVQQPGRYRVQMKFATRYTSNVKQGVDIPCLESCNTVLNFEVPNQAVNLTVNPQLSHAQEDSKITARVAPTPCISVTWTRDETEPLPTPHSIIGREDTDETSKSVSERDVKVKEMVVTSSQDVLHTIGGGVCHTRLTQTYMISNGNKSEFVLCLQKSGSCERDAPRGWVSSIRTRATRVLGVDGPNVRSWDYSDADGNLVVSLDTPAEGECEFVIDAETELVSTSCKVLLPILKPLDVNRNRGAIAIAAHSSVEVLQGDTVSISKVDASELPPHLTCGGNTLLAYKYLTSSHRLTLTTIKHDDVSVITCLCESATYNVTQTATQLLYDLSFNMKNTQTQYMKLTMPSKIDVWSASVGGEVVKPAADQTGRTLIPLVKGSNVAFTVAFVFVVPAPTLPEARGRDENLLFTFPQIDLPITHLRAKICLPNTHYFAAFKGGLDEVEAYCDSVVLQAAHNKSNYAWAKKSMKARAARPPARRREVERMSSISCMPQQQLMSNVASMQQQLSIASFDSDSDSGDGDMHGSVDDEDFGAFDDADEDAGDGAGVMEGGIKPLQMNTESLALRDGRTFLFEKLLVPSNSVLAVNTECCMADAKKTRTLQSDGNTKRCGIQ